MLTQFQAALLLCSDTFIYQIFLNTWGVPGTELCTQQSEMNHPVLVLGILQCSWGDRYIIANGNTKCDWDRVIGIYMGAQRRVLTQQGAEEVQEVSLEEMVTELKMSRNEQDMEEGHSRQRE